MTVSPQNSRPGILSLTAAITVIAALWLIALPWIAEQPQMKSHLDWLDEQKINPSAMYYTELEAMEEILERQRMTERRQRLSRP